jgi:hypothetical protein
LSISVVALACWFWTQALLGARTAQVQGIGDGLHALTAGANEYFQVHASMANALLIASSALIDAFAVFILIRWLFGRSVRPFLGLVILLLLRQAMQALCALPAPEGMIWHYPGFPSLLVTYSVASDFFFSGHTAIAVFGATEVARLRNPILTMVAILVAAVEIVTVIVLRMHYTMDVFTGLIAALWVVPVAERLSVPVDRWLFGTASAQTQN